MSNPRYMVMSEEESNRLLEASTVTRTMLASAFGMGLLMGMLLVAIL